MMRLFVLCIGSVCALMLSTCTKFGKNVYVDGYIRNAITGEPVAGVSLRLYRGQISWGDPVGTDSKTLKSVVTDAAGYYKAEHLSTPFNTVYIQFGNGVEGGYLLVDGQSPTVIKKGKKKRVDFGIVPYGNLQINISNTACFDSNDELKIFRTHSLPNFYDDVPNPAIYTGCINQTGNMNKAPIGWYKYNGTVTKNGIVTLKSDSIFLNEGENKIWNIFY